jgi:PAS domain S-box-containing protein
MKKIRLAILIPLLLIISSLVSSTLLYFNDLHFTNNAIEQAGYDDVKIAMTHLQNVLDTQLAVDNQEDAKLSLSVTALHPKIQTLLLVDEKDTVMLANSYIRVGKQAVLVSGYDEQTARQVRQTRASSGTVNNDHTLIRGYYPVTLKIEAQGVGSGRVGLLFVEYDLSRGRLQARHDAAIQAVSLAGLMCAVALIVALILHLLVSRRVAKIRIISQRFAAGDLNVRTNLQGGDELAELGRTFDQMANNIVADQKALRDSERKLSLHLRQNILGVIEWDLDFRAREWNPAAELIFGYSREEALGRTAADLIVPSGIAVESDSVRRQILSQTWGSYHQNENVTREGRTILCEWFYTPLVDDNGVVIGIMSLARDITEIKRAEEELRRMNERFILATHAGQVGVWDWNIPNNELLWDNSMYRLYGMQKGTSGAVEAWARAIHPEDRAHTEDEIQAALRGEREYAPEHRIVRPDGMVRYLKADSQTFRDEAGKPLRMVGTNIDITELKRAEEELRTLNAELEERVLERTRELQQAKDAAEAANRAKSVFLANMSHELRTPLNAIIGFSDILQRDPDISGSRQENLGIIKKSGDHLLGLINDVLDIAKIEAGRIELELKPFDLGAMLLDVTDQLGIRAANKGLRLQLDQSSEFPRFIVGDETKLRQILINLISNAIKATDQGSVTVRLGVEQNHATHLFMEIEDTGRGVAEEDREKLFQPFVQVGPQGSQQGTGLGLAISRQFAELMGGAISVTSSVGQGSLFRVEVVVQSANPDEFPQASAISGDVTGLEPGQPIRRVLVVEDHQDNQRLLVGLLEQVGFQTRLAVNGAGAVELFSAWQPHFIWMDRRMPVMDGVEATRRIRALPGGDAVKIAAVTASTFREEDAELSMAGFDAVVHKPYRPAHIFACMGQLLGVRFVQAEAESAPTPPPVISGAAMETALDNLPHALRQELDEALLLLDSERIQLAIAGIARVAPELAAALDTHAHNYNYTGIRKALRGRKSL